MSSPHSAELVEEWVVHLPSLTLEESLDTDCAGFQHVQGWLGGAPTALLWF